jgi:hypothetical protein
MVAMALANCADGRVFGCDTAVQEWLGRCTALDDLAPTARTRAHDALRHGKVPALRDFVLPDATTKLPPSPLRLDHLQEALVAMHAATALLYSPDSVMAVGLASFIKIGLLRRLYDAVVTLAGGSDTAAITNLCSHIDRAMSAWYIEARNVTRSDFDTALADPDPDTGAVDMRGLLLPALTSYLSMTHIDTSLLSHACAADSSKPAGAGRATRRRDPAPAAPDAHATHRRPPATDATVDLTTDKSSWPQTLKDAVADKTPASVAAAFQKHPILKAARVDGKAICVKFLLGNTSASGCTGTTCPRLHL